MRIILIYEEIPEGTRVYDLNKLTREEYDKVTKCNGRYINDDEMTPEMEWLAEYLVGKEAVNSREHKNAYLIAKTVGVVVVLTGFVL